MHQAVDSAGAVLAQKQDDGLVRPIAFASRSLQSHERNYGVMELEVLGVVWAVKHFRHYLYGQSCDVYTDHEALKSLLNTPQPSGKLARWGMALQEVDLTIHYRPGKKNANADVLSRTPGRSFRVDPLEGDVDTIVAAVTPQNFTKSGDVALSQRQRKDPTLGTIFAYLEDEQLPQNEKQARELTLTRAQYVVQNGVLFYVAKDKTLRVIPPTSDREPLCQEVHSVTYGAHLQEAKIHSELSRYYWWPGMRSDISWWCQACLTCAIRGVSQGVRVPLTPIPVSGPFDRVGMDIIQFPKSCLGKQYAVVFVYYLKKWPEVFAVKDQTDLTISTLFVEHNIIVTRHGVPGQLLSDRGANFLSSLMTEICTVLGVKKINTMTFHPQTDGLVE